MTKVTLRAIALLILALGIMTAGVGVASAQDSGIVIQNGQTNGNDTDQDADQDSGQYAEVNSANISNQSASNGGNSSSNANDNQQVNGVSVDNNDVSGGDDNSTTDIDITVTLIGDLIELLTAIFAGL